MEILCLKRCQGSLLQLGPEQIILPETNSLFPLVNCHGVLLQQTLLLLPTEQNMLT